MHLMKEKGTGAVVEVACSCSIYEVISILGDISIVVNCNHGRVNSFCIPVNAGFWKIIVSENTWLIKKDGMYKLIDTPALYNDYEKFSAEEEGV